MSEPPSHIRLNVIGGNTYQPKADADVIASQYRKARVGMVPAAARSARRGSRHAGTKRKKVTIGPPCSSCSPVPAAMLAPSCMARLPSYAPRWLARLSDLGRGQENRATREPPAPHRPMLYARRGDRLTDSGADWAKARALAAQPNLAVINGIGGSQADRAKARALAAQPNLAGVGNACGVRTDYDGNFRLVLLHNHLQQGFTPAA